MEKNRIDDEELLGVINSWINMDSYDNRFARKSNEKNAIPGKMNEEKTNENRVLLIHDIINWVKQDLDGYENSEDLNSFLREKGFNHEFNFTKEELKKLLELTQNQITYFLNNQSDDNNIRNFEIC